MSLIALRQALLWCTLINYASMMAWWLTVLLKWQWPYDFCARKCNLSRERVDSINFLGLVMFKAAILLFNLAPLIALSLVNPA